MQNLPVMMCMDLHHRYSCAPEDLARETREFSSPTDGQTRMFYEIVVGSKYSECGLEVLI